MAYKLEPKSNANFLRSLLKKKIAIEIYRNPGLLKQVGDYAITTCEFPISPQPQPAILIFLTGYITVRLLIAIHVGFLVHESQATDINLVKLLACGFGGLFVVWLC